MHEPRVAMSPVPCDRTLADTPARVLVLLSAIATRAPIRDLMSQGGFSAEDHAEGWTLLTRACEYRATAAPASEHFRARSAMAEVHGWVTTHFARFRAALERLHPEAVALFPITDTRYAGDALLALAHVIERLRGNGDEHDRALRATLARRGLDGNEIERLGRLVRDAQSVGDAVDKEMEVEARTAELVALYRWYRDWAETAKRLVARRDYRAALGLAGARGKAE
ncbi:MAG: hypothetical protein JW940_35980 [Polyangiaceae bacterium]|nr:hypothetical protein [Polyangiaceae bacterium]